MSRRVHTVRLPHGYRIECVTVTNRESRTAHLTAHVYEGSDEVSTRYTSMDNPRTCGDLIDFRARWLDKVACEHV